MELRSSFAVLVENRFYTTTLCSFSQSLYPQDLNYFSGGGLCCRQCLSVSSSAETTTNRTELQPPPARRCEPKVELEMSGVYLALRRKKRRLSSRRRRRPPVRSKLLQSARLAFVRSFAFARSRALFVQRSADRTKQRRGKNQLLHKFLN